MLILNSNFHQNLVKLHLGKCHSTTLIKLFRHLIKLVNVVFVFKENGQFQINLLK
jgi:hypothetical protein